MAQHYGAGYDRFIARAGEHSQERWQARKNTVLKYKSGGALLDLGCSSGSFLKTMKAPEWRLFGIEMSTNAAQEARACSGAQIFNGDILDADLPDESFDVVTCFDVLEHVYQPRKVMEQIWRWLKPGGILHLTVPNINSAAVRFFGSYWYGLELPRHLTHFSPESLQSIARSVRLSEVELSTSRYPAIEYSVRYVIDDLLRRVDITRTSLSSIPEPGIPRRIARKAIRLGILPVAHFAISTLGSGECINAVFTRDALVH
jgi:2-polyprenyl-3-methyl-5-hydroxy-6-metoxy-1,4-benzoquinol methylase